MKILLLFMLGAAMAALVCVSVPFLILATTPAPGPTAMPALPLEELRAQAITPADLDRRTEQYIGRVVKLNGQVFQVIENSTGYTLLIDVEHDQRIIATCRCKDRPLVGDYILLYGIVQGRQTYETVLGASMTVPLVRVEQYSLAP